MIDKQRLEEISEADLEEVISNQVAEGRTIEYKAELPGRTDSDKKEFLYDISSFANTSGGDVIYGLEEAQGVPKSIVGLKVNDLDAEKRRLDSIIASGIALRLRYNFHTIPCASGLVLLIRIERSWFGPHRVVFQGNDKFYARNQAGKYPLDVGELRQAFNRGATIAEQMRAFRADRIIALSNDSTPVPISNRPLFLLHVLPFDSFGGTQQYDPIIFYRDPTKVPLLGSSLHQVRINYDGVVIHNGRPKATTYTQIFRSGILEIANSSILAYTYDGVEQIPHYSFEMNTISYLPSAFSILRTMGISPPVAIAMSLINVRGLQLWVDAWNSQPGFPLTDESLILPEQVVDHFSKLPGSILRPTFDQIWNAFGFPKSPNLNDRGEWIGLKT